MTCSVRRRFTFLSLVASLSVSVGYRTFAQEAPASSDGGGAAIRSGYRSADDELLTIEKISVLPFTDNMQGIYARPLEAHFTERIDKMHRWDYVAASGSGPLLSPEELESSPDKARQVSQGLGAEAFFAARVIKGPSGVSIHLSLFLSRDGKLLLQAELKDYRRFEIKDLNEQLDRLLSEIVARLPYSGRVLSRDGNRVTVNLGKSDGIVAGRLISVIQIIKANRHPKFNFLVGAEKEIIGKIKLVKVDETLSFGVVVSEKERGVVRKNAKLGPLDFVTYSSSDNLSLTPTPEEELEQRQDGKMVFGKDARAWLPQSPPTFGQVGGRIGLSRFVDSAQVTGVGALQGTNDFAPSVALDGELWITPEWTFHARLMQGIVPVSNPRSGSTPATLNQSLSYYEAGFGYTLRLGPYAWSPFLEPFMGYFSYRLYADAADPEAFTTMQYQGFKFGVRGETPIGGENGRYGVGGEFSMALNPSLRESPVPSGDSEKNSVVQFGIYGFKKLGERVKLRADLDFDMYSSNFSGRGGRAEPATSASQRYTTLSAGIYYMF